MFVSIVQCLIYTIGRIRLLQCLQLNGLVKIIHTNQLLEYARHKLLVIGRENAHMVTRFVLHLFRNTQYRKPYNSFL